ncbi:MAG: serine hydrolase domain-containing protein [Promethearchaeota archaeon]
MNYNKKLIYGFLISVIVASLGILSAFFIISNKSPINKDPLDSEIEDLMEDYDIPSLTAGIVINNSLVWVNGFGDQPNLDTVYMIGSITKTFTAASILQLNESNLLNLDDDINYYLPFSVRNPYYPDISITPRMLLSHTAGLQTNLYWSLEYYFNNQTIDWINQNLGYEIIAFSDRPTLEDFLNGSLNPAGDFYNAYNWYNKPGREFHYSNAGYQLLSFLIEVITNQTLEQFIYENIFVPLNMTNTGFFYTDFIDNHAIPYEWKDNSNFEFPLYNINVSGAGSIRSTILDMAKYMICFMNLGFYNGIQLISPESVALMHSKEIEFSGTSAEGFAYRGYGLGWFIYEFGARGHGGATPGFSSNMVFRKTNEGSYGYILMFNRGSALIYDEKLITQFIPLINVILFDQAEDMFQNTLSA